MSRILLVDDDRDQLGLRQAIFEGAGHEVLAAATATEALDLLQRHEPSSVILDLCLPTEDDGIQLLRDMRTMSDRIRIYVLSGWTAGLRSRAEAVLADGIIEKPARASSLAKLVESGG
jgi:CheY-like chemotaxis protein